MTHFEVKLKTGDKKYRIVNVEIEKGRNIIDAAIFVCHDKYKENVTDIKSVIETQMCWGCMENQPNQLAHMDLGGCLYDLEHEV